MYCLLNMINTGCTSVYVCVCVFEYATMGLLNYVSQRFNISLISCTNGTEICLFKDL